MKLKKLGRWETTGIRLFALLCIGGCIAIILDHAYRAIQLTYDVPKIVALIIYYTIATGILGYAFGRNDERRNK